jgi:hypothetical protein
MQIKAQGDTASDGCYKKKITSVGDVKKLEPLCTVGRNASAMVIMQAVWQSLKK